ncbi:unnamed protein product [Rotaria socialis]|uniref:BTB domain-containing protein n=1 Tax=Rotaria socialis TaxID=392032 RepID=A0A820QIH3_9BILA|nr:unnamed protein product [Rotaria socialis]
MSTWEEHVLSNSPTNDRNNGSKSDETPREGLGEINHTSELTIDFGKLYNQSDYSDVELIIESEHFFAHRTILAARSEYFRALLYGGLRESQHDNHAIEIKECKAAAFKILLRYIYTGQINLAKETEDTLLDLLGLVHQYGFEQLESSLSMYIQSILSLSNVCIIYDAACLYELNNLREHCALFIDSHAKEIITTNEFLALSPEALSSVVSRDSFFYPEIDIFYAIKNWHDYYYLNQKDQWKPFDNIVSKVRLTLMSMTELLSIVRYSNLFDLNQILDAIDIIHTESSSAMTVSNRTNYKNYRGRLRLNENLATKAYDAEDSSKNFFFSGEVKQYLLDGEVINYDLDRGYTRHLIDDVHYICVKLGEPSIINHIKLLLWDKDTRTYSYYIEVSVDNRNWTRIIDYHLYLCRSWQKLYFTPIFYSRCWNTNNSINKVFHLVSMEVYYKRKSFAIVGDIHAPIENIATIEEGAIVSEGVSRVRNALINGDYQSYDWDTGYTCHQIGSGGIVIQLSQPYVVSSMRLHFLHRKYIKTILIPRSSSTSYTTLSYTHFFGINSNYFTILDYCYGIVITVHILITYIETSPDNIKWSTFVDKRNTACRSWQILTFSPRIVVFVRICGTHNTANEVFHCVHVECPCQPDILKLHLNEQRLNSPESSQEKNGIACEEFYNHFESWSKINKNSLLETHKILPFMIKPHYTEIIHSEQDDDEQNQH